MSYQWAMFRRRNRRPADRSRPAAALSTRGAPRGSRRGRFLAGRRADVRPQAVRGSGAHGAYVSPVPAVPGVAAYGPRPYTPGARRAGAPWPSRRPGPDRGCPRPRSAAPGPGPRPAGARHAPGARHTCVVSRAQAQPGTPGCSRSVGSRAFRYPRDLAAPDPGDAPHARRPGQRS